MLKHPHLTKRGINFRMWNSHDFCTQCTGQPYSFQRGLGASRSFIKLDAHQHGGAMDDSQTSLLLRPATRTRKRSTRRKISKMSSSSRSRPRQRTYTSCTECRRRKQKCNQAKDRPCNHCARRYPPVICTYESQSPSPSYDRVTDLSDRPTTPSAASTTAYIPTTQIDMNSYPAAIAMGGSGYYASTTGYYPGPTTATGYQSHGGPGQYTGPSSGPGGCVTTPIVPSQNPAYYSGSNVGYPTPGTSNAEYYPSGDQAASEWLPNATELDPLDQFFFTNPENDDFQPNTSGV